MSTSTDHFEERARDALHTAVGLGILAYHASKPHRARLAKEASAAMERHRECSGAAFEQATRLAEALWHRLPHDRARRHWTTSESI